MYFGKITVIASHERVANGKPHRYSKTVTGETRKIVNALYRRFLTQLKNADYHILKSSIIVIEKE